MDWTGVAEEGDLQLCLECWQRVLLSLILLRSSSANGPRVDAAAATTQEPLPGRARAEDPAFLAEKQQREQLAEQLRAERRSKKKEHELVLRRIADDRRHVQVKAQLTQATPSAPQSPSEDGAQQLQEQPPAPSSWDGQCLLMIRLPSGASVRHRLPSDCPLETLLRRLLLDHPGLSPSASFLQTFPKRHFGPADLPSSLQALGLTPSATLCLLEPPSPGSPPTDPRAPPKEEGEGGELRPMGSAALVLRDPSVQLPPSPQEEIPEAPDVAAADHHRWGRGQKLDASEEPMDQGPLELAEEEEQEAAEQEQDLLPGLPPPLELGPRGAAGSGHHWPAEGNRLRAANEGGSGSPSLPFAVAQAAEQRLQQAAAQGAEEEEEGEEGKAKTPPGRPASAIPSLVQLSLQGTVALLTAPRKQYCRSLSALTPVLAEQLLAHLAKRSLLSPRSLRLFFGCPLQRLRLDCYPLATNALLQQLSAFPGLRHLSLVSCAVITDQGLSALPHLTHLQHLNLSACVKLTDNCLQFLKGLPHLSHLALDQTRVTDRGLADFLPSAPPSLTHLSLNRTGVTEHTLALLPRHVPQLCLLSIKQTGITDVSALRHLGALQALHLDGTPVSEASLGALSTHPSLSSLTLHGVQSVDGNRALELISGLPLAHLALPSRHTVTDNGMAALCRLSGLLELDLTDYAHISDAGLQHLPQMIRLRRLSLCNTQVTDVGLRQVGALSGLEELALDRLKVSSAGVARCIIRLPHLQVLSLASTLVGDSVARRGLAHCKHLLKVNLSRTRLSDRGLRFLRQLTLVQLNLDGSGVTAVGVAALQASCPSLVSVRASHLRPLAPEELSEEEEGPG
nr:uncharacterized protein LOC132779731 [Anolis sagrei ordinatus]